MAEIRPILIHRYGMANESMLKPSARKAANENSPASEMTLAIAFLLFRNNKADFPIR